MCVRECVSMCICAYGYLAYINTMVYGTQAATAAYALLPQSLAPSTMSWPSLTRLPMQSPPDSLCPQEPHG